MDKYEALKKYFGYEEFREGQEFLIDSIMEGSDAVGIMPTGAGKSVCYQIPAVLLPGVTLVISPLISLMKDQVKALNQNGIRAAYLNSSLTDGQMRKALQNAAAGEYRLIYVAPERLETEEFLSFAMHAEIAMVTIDEAHCISQWGHDFRPSYTKISGFIEALPTRPRVNAFTATATDIVKEDIVRSLDLLEPKVLVTGFDRKNLTFSVKNVRGNKEKNDALMKFLEEHRSESGIVYCSTRKNVEEVCELLTAFGYAAERYHAGLSAEERSRNQDDFVYDRCSIIVATNAFGMGIDKSNVRYVVHYNMPQSIENYYQEAGRAGRDGEPSECLLLFSAQDIMINRLLISHTGEGEDQTPEEIEGLRIHAEQKLRAMTHYCQTTTCLRQYILKYFGEKHPGTCGNCSNCTTEYEKTDITEACIQIVRCIRETGQRYGANMIANVLSGSRAERILSLGLDGMETYGSLSECKAPEIKSMLTELELGGYVRTTEGDYPVVRLGKKCIPLMQGEDRIYMKKEIARPKTKKVSKAAAQLSVADRELFEELRRIRLELAAKANVAPYMVFSDKTLKDMCAKRPSTRSEMMNVFGVGEAKYEKYGEIFLDEIRQYQEEA